jgi:hypothetical protein
MVIETLDVRMRAIPCSAAEARATSGDGLGPTGVAETRRCRDPDLCIGVGEAGDHAGIRPVFLETAERSEGDGSQVLIRIVRGRLERVVVVRTNADMREGETESPHASRSFRSVVGGNQFADCD